MITYKKRNAFTLIELLIVVAIIGILASIVIVTLTGQTDKANAARAKANSRSVLSAISIYLANENKSPVASTTCSGIGSSPAIPLPVIPTGAGCSSSTTNYAVYWAKDTGSTVGVNNLAWCVDSLGKAGTITATTFTTAGSCDQVPNNFSTSAAF
ncbi:MAG: type II secretion system protein [Alphaproteobacteria bacterium]|nr:type II secretion system protein [Alphaproteobacteria bacterium]